MQETPGQQLRNWCETQDLKCVYTSETGSTNDDAKKHKSLMGPTFFVTEHQSKGRGRGENTWVDDPGQQLMFSLALQLEQPPQHLTAPLVGLAVYRGLQNLSAKLAMSIKPPNDLYVDKMKLAGLLVEAQSKMNDHRLIIGLGLNVISHPESMEQATHLNRHIAGYDSLAPFFESFFANVQHLTDEFSNSEFNPQIRAELLEAMRSAPFENELTDLTLSGDLVFGEEKVSWRDL